MTYQLTVNDTNVILQSVSKQAFEVAANVIDVIKKQAEEQLPKENVDGNTIINLEFTNEDLQTIFNSLAKQPYETVSNIIFNLINQSKKETPDE